MSNSEWEILKTTTVPEDNSSLYVANTWLKDCTFLGLFAAHKISKGSLVCIYSGDILRTIDAVRLKDKSYLMRLGEQCYVDALSHTQVYARYINDCINPVGWNAVFDKRPEDKCAHVVALRDIEANEEIFVSYGKWYWASLKPVRLGTIELRKCIAEHCHSNLSNEEDESELSDQRFYDAPVSEKCHTDSSSYRDVLLRNTEEEEECVENESVLVEQPKSVWKPSFKITSAPKQRIDRVYESSQPTPDDDSVYDPLSEYYESQDYAKGHISVLRAKAVTKIRPAALEQKLKRIAAKTKS